MEKTVLDAIVRPYVATMTSIRGRRVQRLLLREFARFDHVLRVTTEDGAPALLAFAADGRAALCRSDGRGALAELVESRLHGASVATAHDLLKDSLPIVRWTLRHPGFAAVAGALTIEADDVAAADRPALTRLLTSAA